jgi:predicted RNA-binding protein with PUA-like domain
MPQHWFFLSDPDTYHFDELFRKGKDVWDGIHGSHAQKYLSQVRQGDLIVGYHTAPQKVVYALLEAVSDAYPDPKEIGKQLFVVDVKPLEKLPNNVPLEQLRGAAKLTGMMFLKIARMSVSPLTATEYREICRLGGMPPSA